jgi:hypothetical protein
MTSKAITWLLLVTNLPGHNPTLRMRTWRALKGAGVGLLRDGAYLLPDSGTSRKLLAEQQAEIKAAGGVAHVLCFQADSEAQDRQFMTLLDRTEEYAELIKRTDALTKEDLGKLTEPEARQQLAVLTREASAIAERDFFPGESRKQLENALADADAAISTRFSPDEPHAANRKIQMRSVKDYKGRTWATRERLWVDRVACAWLIRRFIDPKAKFLWLRNAKDCPKRATGFDFDGAEFTHVGAKVTFEVFTASFALGQDAGLARLAALVHHLDVGGVPVAEAPGFSTILAGARTLHADDDDLLKAMTPVLDGLYAGYTSAEKKN